MKDESVLEKYQRMFEEKQAKMHTTGLGWKPVMIKTGILFSALTFRELPGIFFVLYLVIGDSLAVRQGYGRQNPMWLGVVFLWLPLLILEPLLSRLEVA